MRVYCLWQVLAKAFLNIFKHDTLKQYLARTRITKAQSLLETTNLTMAAIAPRCGFGSADNMRYAFSAALDVTPRAYRQRFGSPGKSEDAD